MGQLAIEKTIRERLHDKPWLLPVFSDVHDISSRLREYDPAYFLVFNCKKQRYEVHTLENKLDTFGFVAHALDARVLRRVRQSNIRTRGTQIFREMDEHNEKLEASNKRAAKNHLNAAAREMKSAFAKVAWEGV